MDEYSVSAKWYDFVVGRPLASVFRRMTGILAGSGPVLDVCCGTGLLAEIFHGANIPAMGVDISPAMLAVGRAKRPHVPFVLADASSLPFAEGSFEAVTLTFALHEKPQPVRLAMLDECRRVVHPGGRLLLADYRQPRGASRLGSWAVQAVERLAGRDHYRHYQDWMSRGAAEGFLCTAQLDWHMRRTILSGTAGVYVVSV